MMVALMSGKMILQSELLRETCQGSGTFLPSGFKMYLSMSHSFKVSTLMK